MSKIRQLLALSLLGGGLAVAGLQQPASVPPKPAQAAGVAKPAPVVRTSEHRKVHRPAPAVARKAKREWAKLPTVRPIPPIAKEEKRRPAKQEKRERPPVKTARRGDPVCARAQRERAEIMRLPLAERIAEGARRMANSGMSLSDINEIRRRCGV